MKEKKTDLNIGILYITLYNLLRKKVEADRIISRKDFFTILGKHYLVPKVLRDAVVREMEKRFLVEKMSRDSIKILECDYDLERDTKKFYQMLGFY